ncbi:MAG TPA: hypothetical protein VGW38_17115, partial [Chloroflexota bacterium]|nr:hypothetical protein [Chloroflexota bacterium]
MRRRTSLGVLAVATSTPLSLLAGCGAPPLPVTRPAAGPVTPVTDALVLHPVRALALRLEDLPDGFRLAEELAPTLVTTPAEDPWGRVGAYSATYVATESSPAGVHDIVSSVNAYTTVEHAKAAYSMWQSAVP